MRKTVCVLFLLALSASQVSGDKVTVDPNLGPRDDSPAVVSADARLQTKVAYEAKQKRLSEIAADLTSTTGVTLGCGKNSKDWRIRDIPLTIRVKDLPLGKLLEAIADCAHVTLGSEKTDKGRNYRFSRTYKQEQELDRWLSDRREWGLRAFKSDWDRAVEFAKATDNGFATVPTDDSTKSRLEYARTFARLLQSLGTDARDRIAAGESIPLGQSGASDQVRPALDVLVAETWKAHKGRYVSFSGSYHTGEPTPEDLTRGDVVLYRDQWSEPPMLRGRVEIRVREQSGRSSYNALDVELTFQVLNFASEPYVKGMSKDSRRIPEWPPSSAPDRGAKLKHDAADPAFILDKVKLDPPKDNPYPTIADTIVALADKAGVNVVCEDFESHKMIWKPRGGVYEEMTITEALKRLSWSFLWFASDDTRLLVGTREDWPERHSRLVPASLIVRLHQSMMKGGIDLDDAIPLASLDNYQISEWITCTRELNCFTHFSFEPITQLWAFYDSLSPEDKTAAKSAAGLPFGKFDPGVLTDILRQCNNSVYREKRSPDERALCELPTDPKVVPELAMRITPEDLWLQQKMEVMDGGSSSGASYTPVKPGDTRPPDKGYTRKTRYWLEIIGKRDGQPYQVRNESPFGFPYRSLRWTPSEKGLTATP